MTKMLRSCAAAVLVIVAAVMPARAQSAFYSISYNVATGTAQIRVAGDLGAYPSTSTVGQYFFRALGGTGVLMSTTIINGPTTLVNSSMTLTGPNGIIANQSSMTTTGGFFGPGSGITALTPGNISAGTAGINITGSAGSVPASGVNLSTVTTQFNAVALATTTIASNLATSTTAVAASTATIFANFTAVGASTASILSQLNSTATALTVLTAATAASTSTLFTNLSSTASALTVLTAATAASTATIFTNLSSTAGALTILTAATAASTATLNNVKASTGTCSLPNVLVQVSSQNVVCQQPSNVTGNAATVTTNANLTGNVTSVGNATTIVQAPPSAVDLSTVTTALATKASTGTCTLPNFPITLNSGNVVCQQPSNVTGNAATVTTNANLTGDITSSGNATTAAATQANIKVLSGLTTISNPFTTTSSMTNTSAGGELITYGLSAGSGTFTSGVTASSFTATATPGFKGDATNLSGTAASLTAGNVTTNANLTGNVTSVGNATTVVAVPQSAVNLSTITTALNLKANSGANSDISSLAGVTNNLGITVSTSIFLGSGTTITTFSAAGFMTFPAISAPTAVLGRFYFDKTSSAVFVSEDGSTFVQIATGTGVGISSVLSNPSQFSGNGNNTQLTLLSSSVTLQGNNVLLSAAGIGMPTGSTITTNGSQLAISTDATASITGSHAITIDSSGNMRVNGNGLDFVGISTIIVTASNQSLAPFAVMKSSMNISGGVLSRNDYLIVGAANAVMDYGQFIQGTMVGPVFNMDVGSGTVTSPAVIGNASISNLVLSQFVTRLSTGTTMVSESNIITRLDTVGISTTTNPLWLPSDITFSTVRQGGVTNTEGARLDSNGTWDVGATTDVYTTNDGQNFQAGRLMINTVGLSAGSTVAIINSGNSPATGEGQTGLLITSFNFGSNAGGDKTNLSLLNTITDGDSGFPSYMFRIQTRDTQGPTYDQLIYSNNGSLGLGNPLGSFPQAHLQVSSAATYGGNGIGVLIDGNAATALQIGPGAGVAQASMTVSAIGFTVSIPETNTSSVTITAASGLGVTQQATFGSGTTISTFTSTGNFQFVAGGTITTKGGTIVISTDTSASSTGTHAFLMDINGHVRISGGGAPGIADPATISTVIVSASNFALAPFAAAQQVSATIQGYTLMQANTSMYQGGVSNGALTAVTFNHDVSSGTIDTPAVLGPQSLNTKTLYTDQVRIGTGTAMVTETSIRTITDSVGITTNTQTLSLPANLAFFTTRQSGVTNTEGARLDSNGVWDIGTTTDTVSDSNDTPQASRMFVSVPISVAGSTGVVFHGSGGNTSDKSITVLMETNLDSEDYADQRTVLLVRNLGIGNETNTGHLLKMQTAYTGSVDFPDEVSYSQTGAFGIGVDFGQAHLHISSGPPQGLNNSVPNTSLLIDGNATNSFQIGTSSVIINQTGMLFNLPGTFVSTQTFSTMTATQYRMKNVPMNVNGLLTAGVIVATVTVGSTPEGVAIDKNGNVWVTNFGDGTVTEVSGSSYSVMGTFSTGGLGPRGIVYDGSIWVLNNSSCTMAKINADTGALISTAPITSCNFQGRPIAFNGNIYIPNVGNNNILVFNQSNVAISTWSTGGSPAGMATDANNLWFADYGGAFYELDPKTGTKIRSITTGVTNPGRYGIAFDGKSLIVPDLGDNTLKLISVSTGGITASYPVGAAAATLYPSDVVYDYAGHAWVDLSNTTTILEIDLQNGVILATVTVPSGGAAFMMASDATGLWFTDTSSKLYKVTAPRNVMNALPYSPQSLALQSKGFSLPTIPFYVNTATMSLVVSSNGAVDVVGGTAPTFTGCGTTPTLDAGSNNQRGGVAMTSGLSSTCTIVFAAPKPTSPHCVLSCGGQGALLDCNQTANLTVTCETVSTGIAATCGVGTYMSWYCGGQN